MNMDSKIDLKALAEAETKKTGELLAAFPWEDREAYAMWLAQTYHMVNHSTRLVSLAGALAPLDRNALHARFVDHAKEERGHQLIAIADMKALGFALDQLPCLPPSAAMYQVQYYWIQQRGATSFFGYTLALELLGCTYGPEIYRRVRAAHGDKASVFLKVHAEDDVDHIEKAYKQIDALTEPEKELVKENLLLSSGLYRSMLEEVIYQVRAQSGRAGRSRAA